MKKEITQFRGEYGWLSNFADCDIEFGGRIYPSVEHAYIAAKCDDEQWKEMCSSGQYTAGALKKVGKEVPLVENWEEKKVEVMKELLFKKFTQEPFRTKLLETGDLYIEEGNWWNDTYWGVCLKTNTGKNVLGRMIMKMRDYLEWEKKKENTNG